MTERMSKVVGDENRGETGILNACLESARFLLPIKALVIRVTVLILSLTWRDLAVWFSFPKDGAGFLLVEGSCPTLSVPMFLLRLGLWDGCAQGPTWLWGTWGSTISVLSLHVCIRRRMRITILALGSCLRIQ